MALWAPVEKVEPYEPVEPERPLTDAEIQHEIFLELMPALTSTFESDIAALEQSGANKSDIDAYKVRWQSLLGAKNLDHFSTLRSLAMSQIESFQKHPYSKQVVFVIFAQIDKDGFVGAPKLREELDKVAYKSGNRNEWYSHSGKMLGGHRLSRQLPRLTLDMSWMLLTGDLPPEVASYEVRENVVHDAPLSWDKFDFVRKSLGITDEVRGTVIVDAKAQTPAFDSLTGIRQAAISVANSPLPDGWGLKEFRKMHEALALQDYRLAAVEMMDSEAARKPSLWRVYRNAAWMMHTSQLPPGLVQEYVPAKVIPAEIRWGESDQLSLASR